MPYKQRVIGSNPVAPTSIKKPFGTLLKGFLFLNPVHKSQKKNPALLPAGFAHTSNLLCPVEFNPPSSGAFEHYYARFL